MDKVTPLAPKAKLSYADDGDLFVIVRNQGGRNWTLPLTRELEAELLAKLIERTQPWTDNAS